MNKMRIMIRIFIVSGGFWERGGGGGERARRADGLRRPRSEQSRRMIIRAFGSPHGIK
jgi:hypothetical protein